MRSLLDPEEVEEKAPEITLSTASVLGIFFGLVLVCGVFFGFGYSVGRGTEMGTQVIKIGGASAPVLTPAAEAAGTTAASTTTATAPEQQSPAPTQVAPATENSAALKPIDEPAPDTTQKHVPIRKPSAALQAALIDQPAAVAADMAAPTHTGQPMVQIAAVARREDADVLVQALRQRGYGVMVRNEPQDRLLHVQVGPFTDHSQAVAMKQKLLSDGYNAIIKE